jgi:hypothetical protein
MHKVLKTCESFGKNVYCLFDYANVNDVNIALLPMFFKGQCMVGWTNFGITQSTFIQPKSNSYDHILLYILELSNESHFECIRFKMYIMQLIGMKYT